jgi:hypothetical protein
MYFVVHSGIGGGVIPCHNEKSSRILKVDIGVKFFICAFPFWASLPETVSERRRTKYSRQPELFRLLARTKNHLEILC